MRHKSAITEVGNIRIQRPGWALASSWGFEEPSVKRAASIDLDPSFTDGYLGGWTAFELHSIAHGVPCNCQLGEALGASDPRRTSPSD